MTPQEYEKQKARLREYEEANREAEQLNKLLQTLIAIDKNEEHTIAQIIIDIEAGMFHYVPINERNPTKKVFNVCMLDSGTNGELYTKFFEWAIAQVSLLQQEAVDRRNEA